MNNVIFEYPLKWLPQQPRNKVSVLARFKSKSIFVAGQKLINELKLMRAKNIVITSNLILNKKGDAPLSGQRIFDNGVVVYFQLKGKSKAMACDRYSKVEDNLWALCLSVEAIRGLERWGGSELLDGLFSGFLALPMREDMIITAPDYFGDCISQEHIRETYKRLAKELHPDKGGNETDFAELTRQYEIAKTKINLS